MENKKIDSSEVPNPEVVQPTDATDILRETVAEQNLLNLEKLNTGTPRLQDGSDQNEDKVSVENGKPVEPEQQVPLPVEDVTEVVAVNPDQTSEILKMENEMTIHAMNAESLSVAVPVESSHMPVELTQPQQTEPVEIETEVQVDDQLNGTPIQHTEIEVLGAESEVQSDVEQLQVDPTLIVVGEQIGIQPQLNSDQVESGSMAENEQTANQNTEMIVSQQVNPESVKVVEVHIEPEQIQSVSEDDSVEVNENLPELKGEKEQSEEDEEVIDDEEVSSPEKEVEVVQVSSPEKEIQKETVQVVANGIESEKEESVVEVEQAEPVLVVEETQPIEMSGEPDNLGTENTMQIEEEILEKQVEQTDLVSLRNRKVSEDERDNSYDLSEQNKVFIWGSAESDQFACDQYESKSPIEISYFSSNKIKVAQIACGNQHTLVLDNSGKVHSWGNCEDGALGREISSSSNSAVPDLMDLDEQVDHISAGEAHSVMANSQTGKLFFTGVIKSKKGNLSSVIELPEQIGGNTFRKLGIRQIVSGSNHVLVLAGPRLYSFGDGSCGALGHLLRNYDPVEGVLSPNALRIKSIDRIFSGAFHCFAITKKNKVMAWGLNNIGQLGLPFYLEDGLDSDVNNEDADRNPNVLQLPHMVPSISGAEVVDIVGGEQHTLVLLKDGCVLGAGRDDDGQLGNLKKPSRDSYVECKEANSKVKVAGTSSWVVVTADYMPNNFMQIPLAKTFQKVSACAHFNYATNTVQRDQPKTFTWGSGFNYVLGNGTEEAQKTAYRLSNETLFKKETPTEVALGYSHVVYFSGQSHPVELDEPRSSGKRSTINSSRKGLD